MESWMLPEVYQGTYRLTFSDPTFDGFECVMKRHTLGALKAASKTFHINVEDARAGRLNKKDWQALTRALDQFAKHLDSWNLKDAEGYDVPANRVGVDTVDLVFLFQIYTVWLRLIINLSVYENFEPDDIPMDDINAEDSNDGE